MNVDTLKRRSLQWLVVLHRWLGIGGCLLFILWFLSGLVMLYVGFPDLTAGERARYQAPLEWRSVQVTPDRILTLLSLDRFPQEFRLEMSAGRPVYRVSAGGKRFSLSAEDGQALHDIGAAEARTIAAQASGSKVLSITTIDMDQWTVAGTFEDHRPLHRVSLSDAPGTELYVSSRTGEIVLDSTARERTWNWVGSVVHWLYFTPLRAQPTLWSQVVKWVSGACIFVAITGLWLGVDRLRMRRRNGSLTPFRGWMAWHHLAGIVGGVIVLTWIFSGWLSMGPAVPWNSKFDPERRTAGLAAYAGHTEATLGSSLDVLHALGASGATEASFSWLMGSPQIALVDSERRTQIVDARSGEHRVLSRTDLDSWAGRLVPGARLLAAELLEHEDEYWHSGDRARVLPVLLYRFDDEEHTWIHVDPASGRIVGWLQSGDRVHRWLFDALHTLDFGGLARHERIRVGLVWLLSAFGLAISVTGAVIGWRRLRVRTLSSSAVR